MDTRKLRQRAGGNFAQIAGKAKTLREASDDGFTLYTGDERAKLAERPMVILAWDLRAPFRANGVPTVMVYANIMREDGTAEPIKALFGGGGPLSIPGMLQEMQDNGITGDVTCQIMAEPYSFVDESDGSTIESIRFTLEDLPESSPDY